MLSACWMGKRTGGGALDWMRRLVEVVMGGGAVVVLEGEEAILSSRVLITSDARDVLMDCFL
mgnify:CR=1 FL=1